MEQGQQECGLSEDGRQIESVWIALDTSGYLNDEEIQGFFIETEKMLPWHQRVIKKVRQWLWKRD